MGVPDLPALALAYVCLCADMAVEVLPQTLLLDSVLYDNHVVLLHLPSSERKQHFVVRPPKVCHSPKMVLRHGRYGCHQSPQFCSSELSMRG